MDRLQRFAMSFNGNLLLLNEEKRGLGYARNKGWRQAKASIVAYTDDDCYPQPDMLDCILAAFDDSRIGFVGGRVLLFDPNDAETTIRLEEKRRILVPPAVVMTGWVIGANMAFRREALEQIGGFDGLFGPGAVFRSADDTDAQARVLAAGWHAIYEPSIVVYHHHGRKPGADVLKLKQGYHIGRGAYYAKCVLNPTIRYIYLRNWMGRLIKRLINRPQLTPVNRLEIYAAIKYFRHIIGQRLWGSL
jgi:GT2 family glycosyltransferase